MTINTHDLTFLPSATIDILKNRADLLKKTRIFFDKKDVLEVETPVLSGFPAIEVYIDPFITQYPPLQKQLYLQSSPEYAMKRLLVGGSGPIYQISHAFRNEEAGKFHNPEFTMIEWYRPGFSMFEMIDEVENLVSHLLNISQKAKRITFADLFIKHTGLDPHAAHSDRIYRKAKELGLDPPASLENDKDSLLDFLLMERIEAKLGFDQPLFVYHYPVTRAGMANIRPENPPVAERFELYIHGMELCNGYHELIDDKQQKSRLTRENKLRQSKGKPELPIDTHLIAALKHGLLPCSGVSLGFDRLVMLATGRKKIQDVVAFPIGRA